MEKEEERKLLRILWANSIQLCAAPEFGVKTQINNFQNKKSLQRNIDAGGGKRTLPQDSPDQPLLRSKLHLDLGGEGP